MLTNRHIIKSDHPSNQLNVEEDYFVDGSGVVEPYADYDILKVLYSANLYHQRAIKLKAGLLSQVEGGTLAKYLPQNTNIKNFLYKMALNLEVYGSSFLEKAGTATDFNLYNMNTHSTRVDLDHNVYQKVSMTYYPIEALHLKYDSILSDFYGEPDYLAIIKQIATLFKADAYNNLFFENGGKPELAFIFEDSDPSDDQIDAITSFVKKSFGGYKNAHKNLILTTGEGNGETKPKIRIEKIGEVEDLSFEKLKAVGRDEIAAAHGVPPRLLGIVEKGGLGGGGELMGQVNMFMETTINPRLELIEWFFAQNGIELELARFNIDSLTSSEDVADELVKSGIITAIEKRNILG